MGGEQRKRWSRKESKGERREEEGKGVKVEGKNLANGT